MNQKKIIKIAVLMVLIFVVSLLLGELFGEISFGKSPNDNLVGMSSENGKVYFTTSDLWNLNQTYNEEKSTKVDIGKYQDYRSPIEREGIEYADRIDAYFCMNSEAGMPTNKNSNDWWKFKQYR